MSARPREPRLSAPRGALVALALACSCIKSGYPLSASGRVSVTPDVAGALYAADTLDANGNATGQRQKPYSTGVSLTLTEGGEAAYGAYVLVHVEPAEALALVPAADGEPGAGTCETVDGAFRCTATEQGYARFDAISEGAWSGDASIVVTWADTGEASTTIHVRPAGLPQTATSFELIVGSPSDHVLATNLALACATGPEDAEPGDKWREGHIRALEAYARATPPFDEATAVVDAPVLVESLSSEAALSLVESCADRVTRLRVTLGATGESSRFYLCMSDLGGAVSYAMSSGELSGTLAPAPRQLSVDAEPRLLRVSTLAKSVPLGETATLFEVSAYDAALERIAMDVDLTIDSDVLKLGVASVTLGPEGAEPTLLDAEARGEGTAQLHVTPRLLDAPDCTSEVVSVSP